MTDTERLEKLAEWFVWWSSDAGLPARWEIMFADQTEREKRLGALGGSSGTFDVNVLREAIDAVGDI